MVSNMTVFNTSTDVDTKKQPMFFGQPLGLQRYDSYSIQFLIDLLNNNWDISGYQKRFPFRKIEVIISHCVQNKNIFSAVI